MLESMLRQQPQDGACLFVDMNSFFASCEQQANPDLRGRPIGVCPFVSNATTMIAASIEAKKLGVKSVMRVPEAKRICPQIQLVPANPRLYRHYHRRLMAALDQLPCKVLPKSVDEALLTVPGYLRPDSLALARQVKQQVQAIGDQLKCSVGIGSNMFLAKMGTNLMKPDGLIEAKLSDLEAFYRPLKLTDLHGISFRLERRLKSLQIFTPLEFFRTPHALLKKAFGIPGEMWYLRLRGYEVDLKPTNRSVIGHQTTIIPRPATSRAEVLSVASQLTYRAAIRLRAAGVAAKGVVVGVRFDDRSWWAKVYHGREAFTDSATFFSHVKWLLSFCRLPKPVRLVSVSAIDLVDASFISQKLFDDHDKQERLSQALDEINFRYGEATVRTGRQALTKTIHDAIGYGNAVQNTLELPH